jgi:hypothetical protein
MEFDGGKKDVVDPEVRAYVSSLVSAVSQSNSDVIFSPNAVVAWWKWCRREWTVCSRRRRFGMPSRSQEVVEAV